MVDQQPGKSGGTTEATGQRENPVNQGSQGDGPSPFAAPSISLPKGGGAIRGMGEKFATNPVTGTGSMTVPIAVSPGRAGFGPQLSLSYDSGAGNGPFGLGWNLSLPAITRKTDKGLPKYQDADESDVFILSGAEDLVPVLNPDGSRFEDTTSAPGYKIHRYRPRIEGLFARIERWTDTTTGEIRWRSITKDNITTWYGKSNKSRIADPADTSKVFTWLICESYDDKGNAILYQYKPENSIKEDSTRLDNAHVNEKNRTDSTRKANRYLKCINYCNQTPRQPDEDLTKRTDWLMEVFFDYGDEHYIELPEDAGKRIFVTASLDPTNLDPANSNPWPVRADPFSTYRSGFEIRTYRLCRRVLMFHRFAELGATPCLVRSTEFQYNQTPISSFITSVKQSGYVRQSGVTYLKKSLPAVEFTYSKAVIEERVRELDAESLENLPYGLDGSNYQWVDLDGDGVAGILTEQANAWFYKRNLSPKTIVLEGNVAHTVAKFAPMETIAAQPSFRGISGGAMQFLDLAGDGRPDLVQFDGPAPGFYEHEEDDTWTPHRPFTSLPNVNWRDPNLKFVDLTGDGHADILISEDDIFTWYPSLAEAGFGASERTHQPFDEEKGPRLIFADGTQSIFLADFSGDGLTDIVRIRNGEVCYWPNLGYGRFGAKVTMDGSPWFDRSDQFDQRRIRLADIDGSGVTDIIYLHGDGIHLYFNQSGNSWSKATPLDVFPRTDNLSSVTVTDLLGNGTACLVWSSPLPGEARRPMRYVDLMGGQKPHLMITSKNNLGAETRVHYAPSTKFYLQDKYDSKPWITRLPFPVHVVERVETFDHISRNHFVTRYAYHHGYFDGEEREFRGFGMVEQWDTDEFNKLDQTAANVDASWHMPPVHTKTWFHTGAYFRGQEISRHLAHEYFGAPLDKTQFERWLNDALLPDTVFPEAALSADETREACRALKGAMLRQELYADDGSARKGIPYTVTEQNFTIEHLQSRAGNRHAVFFTHPREAISYHYERNLNDPRVTHAMTLEVDPFGNVLRSAAIGYRRNALPGVSAPEQQQTHVTLSANRFANHPNEADWYRIGLPVEARAFEVVKPPEPRIINNQVKPFSFVTMRTLTTTLFPLNNLEPEATKQWPYEKWDWRANATNAPPDARLRSIEHVRTLYRKDDLTALLPLGDVESLALPGESYKLALTPSLLSQVFRRKHPGQPDENLLPTPAGLLEGKGADEGGYVLMDGNWWIPSGRIFFDSAANIASPNLTAARELTTARQQFFLPQKFADPFGQSAIAGYDTHHLLVIRTRDALGNTVDATNDYRVLQPRLVTDPNGNRTGACFDALGMVAATAVMGKDGRNIGDKLDGVEADLSRTRIDAFVAQPRRPSANPAESEVTQIVRDLLQNATTRIVYDLDRFSRIGKPPFAATIAREKHVSDLAAGEKSKLQVSFSYSDGFGREIQKKIQAEPGPLVAGGPVINPRWVGSGWTIFNNKGKPVRQYEPFFDNTHDFKFGHQFGVSTILFYDPVERVVATLHPNHTYEKVVFDPWQQTTWDVNDTTKAPDNPSDPPFDPKDDPDVGRYFELLPDDEYLPTWHALRTHSAYATKAAEKWPDAKMRDAERDAADKAADHGKTPTTVHLDTLGRPFLTYAHNGFEPNSVPTPILFATRVELDIEGNQRAVIDAKDRIVMRYDYDMLGARIHQISMEAGERWMLNNVAGKPIRGWNSRRFDTENEYDALQRPTKMFVTGEWNETPNVRSRKLVEEIVYGENRGGDKQKNLRGKVYQHFDTAGIVTNVEYDFKGNLRESSRQFLLNYKVTPDWNRNPARETEVFTSLTKYDALNRPTSLTTPDGSVHHPTFNEANLLDKIDVNLRGAAGATPFVTNIDYNAKGQRVKIEYGNLAVTTYEYDEETFRLTNLKTTRPPGRNGMSSQLFESPTVVQDLHYLYDPAGNITQIADDAFKTVINGVQIDAIAEYTYDPIYRLIEATGREHIPQTEFRVPRNGGDYRDYPFWGSQANPSDPRSLQNYIESYEYDAVGNFERVIHQTNNLSAPRWTRSYAYGETSLIEDGSGVTLHKISNRLSSTTINGNGANRFTENYSYDEHGNMKVMSHLSVMEWDFRDQLQATAQQHVTIGTPETTWYVYDSGGQRVRKVTDNASSGANPTKNEERLYLGGFEIYRQLTGTQAGLVRETLHIMDDKQRIVLVETRTDKQPLEQLIRYQYSNHLGSASLELDDQGQIVSYEEYAPYGSSTYQAVRSQTETAKRYRYTGMERDEESGLSYHGARYYLTWLGRWSSVDPVLLTQPVRTLNGYFYGDNQPVNASDPSGRDIVVRPESKLTAKQIVELIQKNEELPPAVRQAFSVKPPAKGQKESNVIAVSQRPRLGPGETLPAWFTSIQRASVQNEWEITTGLSQKVEHGSFLIADIRAEDRPGYPDRTGTRWVPDDIIDPRAIVVGTTIPSYKWKFDLAADDRAKMLGYRNVQTHSDKGLIVVSLEITERGSTYKLSTSRLAHTVIHELALHAGRMSGQIPQDKVGGKEQVRMPAAEDDPLVADWKLDIERLFKESPTVDMGAPATPDAGQPAPAPPAPRPKLMPIPAPPLR